LLDRLDTRCGASTLLAEDVLDTTCEHVSSSQPTGNVQSLLPALMFPPFLLAQLLQSTIILHKIIVVMEVKVDACAIEDSSRNLAPSAMPVI
jgi:hypothetical protein